MFVGGNEGNVTQLLLEVNTQGFYAVTHAISGGYSGQILQEIRKGSLVWRLFEIIFFVVYLLLNLLNEQLFVFLARQAPLRR
jgi:hypothetical protein